MSTITFAPARFGLFARLNRLVGYRVAYLSAAALVLGLAAGVRLFGINRLGFNSDEAVYAGQAAALAGHEEYARLFGVFRAHPLLVHFVVSVVYRITGVTDIPPRLVSVAFGIGMVAVAGAIAMVTKGRVAGLLTMGFLALSAYPVTVSRQLLLDGPMAFFFALTLLFLVLHVQRRDSLSLYAAACSAGLAFLAKETAVLIVPAVLAFLILAEKVPIKIRELIVAAVVYLVTIAPFPLALLLSGGSRLAQEFFIWQVFRRPNHDPLFYLTVIPSLGVPIVAMALVGLAFALRRRQPLDLLMITFTVVVVTFFEIWPVKGFQYLIPTATPIALLASDGVIETARFLARTLQPSRIRARRLEVVSGGAISLICCVALTTGSVAILTAPGSVIAGSDSSDEAPVTMQAVAFTAGTGGLEASRPVGTWVRENTLSGSRFLTIGPSLANVIQFYGQRQALALSVSPNPLHRNPTYQPVLNPDLTVRTNAVQYLVYDAYTAQRTPYFAEQLMRLVHKYNGVLVYSYYTSVVPAGAASGRVPLVLIYEVHP